MTIGITEEVKQNDYTKDWEAGRVETTVFEPGEVLMGCEIYYSWTRTYGVSWVKGFRPIL